MKSKTLTISMIAAYALLHTAALAENELTLDPIVVGADFRDKKLSQTTQSVTVIGEEDIYDKASQSFIETLASTPNVNFSAGASKAKYIQIRGIGERSQFEAPVNPSVGLIVDGIDFSSSTLGVGMFDVKQIEVLRGPQGTTFGANGMAGVVTVQSNEPTKETEGHIEATIGNYNTKAFGAAVGGTLIEDTLLGRVSVYKNTSDGFMENSFLNREDTQNIDELTAKVQLRWLASDNHTIDFNYMHIDVDNGYDAFTLDNSRDSHSDNPGQDAQKTDAFAITSTYQVNEAMHLVSKISYSKTDSIYSYDEDWTYAGEYFIPSLGWDNGYDYFDEYRRDIEQADIDVRLVSDKEGRIFNGTTDWTIGVYAKKFDETMNRNRIKWGEDNFSSYTQDTENKAIYGQLDTAVTNQLTLITALRVENWEADYSNSAGERLPKDETLTGGKLGLNYQHSDKQLYYISLAKGYKPGGVNAEDVPTKAYETETLWNLEAGLNSSHFNDTLRSRLNIFYGKRNDQQVKLYEGDAVDFRNYLSNAEEGSYYGLESQLDYYPNDALHIYSSIGLLRATFDEFSLNPEQEGRAPAQSPDYQYNIGFDYMFAESFTFKSNVEGRGSYYYSNTHDQKSEAYTLLNSSIEYIHGNWSASLWGRNLTDETYGVRGFFFGNNPTPTPGYEYGYEPELFIQQGAPRTIGLTVSYDF
ncbi:TonB-dependent receptor [Sulfurovum sp. CS9]|uniref:TonB-dependent receptor n=1 Tax=Sulfurovum sp. CS9 TaxID=3391146 RepID=UPI0039E98C3B